MADSSVLRIEHDDALAILTLQRPERSNALSRDLLLALGDAARQLVADPAVRVLVLTGAGDKAFCAGADLKERLAMSEDDVRAQLALYTSELGVLAHSPKPVVAAINGVAFGGGLELALLCDLRVAAAHARFALPETTLGIIPGAGGTQRLPRLVAEGRAKEMILLGQSIDADQALRWGLVNHVCPPGTSLIDETRRWVTPLLRGAPLAHAAALHAIDVSFDEPLARGLDVERNQYETTLSSEDRREALRAFAEKRPAKFVGR